MMHIKNLKSYFDDINWHKIFTGFLLVFCLASGLATLVVWYQYRTIKKDIVTAAYTNARKEAVKAAQQVDDFTKQLSTTVHALAVELSAGKLSPEQLIERLKEKPATIVGFGVAYGPYAFDKSKKLYAPYYVERGNSNSDQFVYLEQFYDYTLPQYAFYFNAMHKGSGFQEPFFDPASDAVVTGYSEPFYDANLNKIGVVFANQSESQFRSLTDNMSLRAKGYGSIFTNKGTFITHPNRDFALNFKTVFQLAQEQNNDKITVAVKKAINKESAFLDYYMSAVNGQQSVIFFEPIKSTGWSLAAVYVNDELGFNFNVDLRHKAVLFYAFLISFLMTLCFLFMYMYRESKKLVLLGSLMCTIVIFGGVYFVWKIAYDNFYDIADRVRPIADKTELTATLDKYMKDLSKVLGSQQKTEFDTLLTMTVIKQNFVTTPVGLDLHYLEMKNGNTVKFIGHFWQRIEAGYSTEFKQAEFKPGITFPLVETRLAKEAYEYQKKNSRIIGWEIQGELKQNFDFAYYPFDTQTIQFSIWPAEFDNKVVLTPDLDAYRMIARSSLVGIDSSIALDDWRIIGSYFGLEKNKYLTNFGNYQHAQYGIIDDSTKSDMPELTFNIMLTRRLSNAVLADLLPIAFILLLLFMLIFLLYSKSLQTLSQIIGMGAVLCAATLLAHMRFKSVMVNEEIVFFEYLYFILYFLIIAITLFAIVYLRRVQIKTVPYQNLLMPLMVFWPLVMSIIFLISVIKFY